MATLELKHVSKQFGGLTALTDIDLQVREGEFVALIGPSGCGKSTLLRMWAGLEQPTGGQVLQDGKPIEAPGPDRTLIFQEHALYPWRTVADNVGFGLELAGTPARERRERVQAVLQRVGLADFAAYYPSQLSGGMRQRAAIARALVMNPAVLLLDEPYGALDAMTRLAMQNDLLRLWEGSGKTMVLVTHDIEEALYLADRIVVMSARPGRIIQEAVVDLPRPRRRGSPHWNELRQLLVDSIPVSLGDPADALAAD